MQPGSLAQDLSFGASLLRRWRWTRKVDQLHDENEDVRD